MNIKKLLDNYNRYGLINFIKTILEKINIKLNLCDPIQSKRNYLSKKIEELTGGKILSGLYENTKLADSKNYYFCAKSSQLLGCYEQDVQEEIKKLKEKYNFKYLVNLGAGEGYHSVGCLNNKIIEYAVNFEMVKINRDSIEKNFQINNLQKKFSIFSKAEENFIELIGDKINLEETLFLFDIEGDEFKLLNENNLSKLRNSYLIIELHHFYSSPSNNNKLIEMLNNTFNVKFIKTGSRNFSKFKVLNSFSDDEKWLMMSESRPKTMRWVICEPKA
tara:strand:+ start:6997 stop:7824 length:828 start_codon:yes stop_codon:yes gene_type:complete